MWLAYDNQRQANVAVKVLHSNLAGDRVRLDRFKRGARIMAELQHEAVVHVLEPYGEDGGWHYFVMEHMRGGDLRRAIVERRLSQDDALLAILHVSGALAEAHKRGIIHRDIKPANIILDDNFVPKLTDFDLVGVEDTTGGTRTGGLGTIVYAAPEVMSRPQDADARADVYGLGMTAVFCLRGGELSGNVMGRVERVIDALSCGAQVKAVLKRATDWDEDAARYPNAGAFQEALATAILAPAQQEVAHEAVVAVKTPATGPSNEVQAATATSIISSVQSLFQGLTYRIVGGRSGPGPDEKPSTLQLLTSPLYTALYARSYLERAKMSEAKNTIGAIARGLAAYMEREDEQGNRATRFPPSTPPAPPEIPRGTKSIPDEHTWSHPTWEEVRFMINSPVYFSYQIETAPDGRTAVARAIGDLSGDGKILIFERTVSVDPTGNVVLSPEVITREGSGAGFF